MAFGQVPPGPGQGQFGGRIELAQMLRREREKIAALEDRYADLANRYGQQALVVKRLAKWVERAAERIKYVEDIPGKRVPYFFNIPIEVPPQVQIGANNAPQARQVQGQQLFNADGFSMDGPFVCTQWMAAFLCKTYSLGPTSQRPQDALPGTEVITPLTGRWRPISSTADPMLGAYIGGTVGAATIGDASLVNTFRPGTLDFLFKVEDNGSDRQRQNDQYTPSRFLYSEFDRPLYLPVSDFFERGDVVKVSVIPTRDPGLVELNYTAYNGIPEGQQAPVGTNPRVLFAIGGTLVFSLVGYKILQAQSPAV